jgi:CubicO group peptidase (beta-lactamase class C family)
MKKIYLITIIIALGIIFGCEKNPEEVDSKQYIWDISTPETHSMDHEILDSAFMQAGLTGFIDGILVIRNGSIVAEEYYNEYDAFTPHNIMSVSKSFLSAITGLALHQGYIDNLNQKMLNYFPEYIYPGMDPRKNDISILHLLTMRMGIRGESEDDYRVYWETYISDNWIKKTIESPLISNPGEKMRYNTFQTHLLSAIITKATQKSIWDFATESLFDPMKIDIDFWEQDPQGYYFGGNAMYFTAREMALLGYLYLNNGRLNGIQIIPVEWAILTMSPSTNFDHPNQWGAFENYNYAYLWWLGQINGHDLFMGYGHGGQFVVVFPQLDLIVVSIARYEVDPDTATVQEWAIFDIIATHILPSLKQ